jgi:phosphohistidine swiveling domain-containing protein
MNEPSVPSVVAWIDDPHTVELGSSGIGGKAFGLALLSCAGLPVPAAFVVLPEAFISGPLDGTQTILVAGAADEIAAACVRLAEGRSNAPVAVRSSATVEDGAVASHAGQFLTILDVQGADAVIAASLACAASLHARAAEAYRAKRLGENDVTPARMAVVVQRMIEPEYAGVAFTVDPISGNRQSVVVNAARGLGTAVVDGTTAADRIWVNRTSLRVVDQSSGTPEGLCIRPSIAASVARHALAAESVIGAPADVEWAARDGAVWVLQARRITGLHESTLGDDREEATRGSTLSFPFEWPEPSDASRHWRRDGRRDTGPATPWDEIENSSFARAHEAAGATLGRAGSRRVIALNGYRFSTDVPDPVPAAVRVAQKNSFESALLAIQARDQTYWEAVLEPEIAAGNLRLDAIHPESLDGPALASYLADVLRWHERLWVLHLHVLHTVRFGPYTFRAQLQSLLQRHGGDDAVAEIDGILSHVETLTSESVAALAALADIVRANPDDASAMLTWPPPTALSEPQAITVFRHDFQSLLRRFSLRADAGAFTIGRSCQPGWRDRPDLPLAIIARYAAQNLNDLTSRKADAVRARDAVVSRLRALFPEDSNRVEFDRLLGMARREVAAYENHNHAIDASASALLWRARNAVAKKLHATGVITCLDDVIWLALPEIDAALHANSEALAKTSWQHLISGRRSINLWQRSLHAPDWIGAAKSADGSDGQPSANHTPKDQAVSPKGVLVAGQPGSRGQATGRVRHVPPDAELPEVEPGDVLVARNAGALWSPILPLAAAVVLEEGALLQHAMLICREFAVPGIVQAKSARLRLAEGSLVTVDGTHGWVTAAVEME